MAIDIHCHLWIRDFYSQGYWEALANFLAGWSTGRGKPTTASEIEETIFPQYWDPDGEVTIRHMDEAGIEKAVIMPVDVGLKFGEAVITIERQNRHLARVAEKHPGRLLYFYSLDPRRAEAAELFETAVREWGARGLKLFTLAGFYPDDKIVYPLLEKAASWGLPLIVHTGTEYPPFEDKYAHPSRLDRILADFPELKVVAAHLSMVWWRQLIELGQARANLMCDVSAFQFVAIGNYGQFCHILRRVLDGFGMHRVMFGTDGPCFDPFLSKKQWLECVRDLPHKAPPGINFTQEEISAVLQGSAESLLASTPENI